MIGQLVSSKAGHDKGQVYVIMAEDDRFVYLSDGRLKEPQKPKKKNKKHIQPISICIEETLREKLESSQPVRTEEIKYAIKQYKLSGQK